MIHLEFWIFMSRESMRDFGFWIEVTGRTQAPHLPGRKLATSELLCYSPDPKSEIAPRQATCAMKI
jgi:hypothetical protein